MSFFEISVDEFEKALMNKDLKPHWRVHKHSRCTHRLSTSQLWQTTKGMLGINTESKRGLRSDN